MRQRARDLHHVLLRDAQAAGRHIGVEVGTQLAQYRRRPRAQLARQSTRPRRVGCEFTNRFSATDRLSNTRHSW